MIASTKSRRGLTLTEVLIAAAVFSLVTAILTFSYRTQVLGGLKHINFSYHQKNLILSIGKIKSLAQDSHPSAIHASGSILSIQPTSKVTSTGKVEWAEHLDVFYLSDNSLLYRRYSNNDLSSSGVQLNTTAPTPISDAQLQTLASGTGQIMVSEVLTFQVSAASGEFPSVSASLDRPNGQKYTIRRKLGRAL